MKIMPKSKFDVMREEYRKGYIEGGHVMPKRTKVPKAERRCFQMHVSHHIRDLHYPPKQAVRIAYEEQRSGKLKGVCKVRKVS